jgi:secreted PhoX family phosphatase
MSARTPRQLPLLPHSGGRSATVCHYRCGDACSQPVPNSSGNEYLGDVIATSISRRILLGGAVGLVGLGAASTLLVEPSPATAVATPTGTPAAAAGNSLGFTPIAPVAATVDAVTVPDGFTWSALIRWGDPILRGAPGFDFEKQTAAAQAAQFGYNNDFTALIAASSRDGVLVCNHEYTNESLMFRGWVNDAAASVEQLKISMAAHGLSLVEVSRRSVSKPWTYDPRGRKNRRITAHTPFRFTGPAAGSSYLKTTADPRGATALGTLNNCSGSVTPWGTILSGEENINQYFRVTAAPTDAQTAAGYRRYGIATGTGRDWYRADERFDTGVEPNEPHRFGWVIEIDPDHPTSTPRKHTAMGRFKHEAATIRIAADGRAVAYLGDDERFDYLYKFVSKRKYRKGRSRLVKRHNMALLSEGDLYVARFAGTPSPDHDGTGTWIPLVTGGVSRVPGMSVEQVLVFTRLAADKVAATTMDRPEDVQPSPVTGKVYMSCTNNSNRTASQIDAANPRANNKSGHVIEISETNNDAAATTFDWAIVLVCGNPDDPSTYFSGYDRTKVSPISCPDNLAFDRQGNLWIATDGQPDSIGLNDALHAVPISGAERGHVQQFLAVPTGAETCGPVISEDGYTVLVAVQHPGDVVGATPEKPASTFPYDGTGQPRPSVIQVHRKDGKRRSSGQGPTSRATL